MAINSFDKQCDKISTKYSAHSSRGNLPSSHLAKLTITADGSITSCDSKGNKLKKNRNQRSPYLNGDSVQLLSRVTERKLYAQHKTTTDFVSSFPLAASIYRANSDEFKSPKKCNKKVKKSVLTLPNARTASPQTCTVSDTNDFDTSKESQNLRVNKRLPTKNRSSRARNKNYEFYDRDACYCSQMNISLDCSSTDMINQYAGDCKRIAGRSSIRQEQPAEREFNNHDVWAVLRNINRFQFRPSPPMSEDSVQAAKKKKTKNKRKRNRNDTRVFETCTEEFAYISGYNSPVSFSQSSSFDRITVIDNMEINEFEKSIIKTTNIKSKPRQPTSNNKNLKKNIRNNTKTIGHREHDEPLQNKNQRDNSPITVCRDTDVPEKLVPVGYNSTIANPQNIYASSKVKLLKSSETKVGQSKKSNSILHSGSSKAAVENSSNILKECDDKLLKVPSNESNQHVEGITQVILSKGQSIMLSKRNNEIQNIKPRQETTVQSMTSKPKLTQTEIKRRLANMKFPIVILEKDQVCSTSIQQNINYEPPHLQGLDQQIWPFMKDWYNTNSIKNENGPIKQQKANEKPNEIFVSKIKHQLLERKNLRRQNETTANKPTARKEKTINEEFTASKKKISKRPLPPNEVARIKTQTPKKSKPILNLKDKMLKLLYKNTSAKDIGETYKSTSQQKSSMSVVRNVKMEPATVDTSTETVVDHELFTEKVSRNAKSSPKLESKKTTPIVSKQYRARAKWAGDFIETVIKRIKSGVYYNQEIESQHKLTNADLNEVSIQTMLTGKDLVVKENLIEGDVVQEQNYEHRSEIIFHDTNNYLEALPGFDEDRPIMEIQTLNTKEVAIKHCSTNVMVQFDIDVPSEPEPLNSIQKSSSLVPLTVTESHTKIFKCKTTIINAMLPAEICSLLPRIIRNIIDSNKSPSLPVPTAPYSCDSNLYTISELSHTESQDIFKPSLPIIIDIAPALVKLLKGVFYMKEIHKPTKLNNNVPTLNYNAQNIAALLQTLPAQQFLPYIVDPLSLNLSDVNIKHIENNRNDNECHSTPCMALEVYKGTKSTLNTVYRECASILENTCNRNCSTHISVFINHMPLLITFGDKNITLHMTTNNLELGEKTFINKLNFNSIYQNFKDNIADNVFNNNPLNAIEYNINLEKPDKQRKRMKNITSHIKPRKEKFVKLYKKCKSTSNITGERNSTSLSKIVYLEDFLQALGTGKSLVSIFDGINGKKILSSLLELKTWITEITQRQAMLILLLTNKKDTPNLVRFRPILLQGIAVNRITRASELDMEIEVIETENFNKFSKFEGIPYITETVQDHDILMEELYWIAKTTASDYQKPFNEASERLLKSLLEKRKRLNPSYLRVMARYVGLGLLKSSNKN